MSKLVGFFFFFLASKLKDIDFCVGFITVIFLLSNICRHNFSNHFFFFLLFDEIWYSFPDFFKFILNIGAEL